MGQKKYDREFKLEAIRLASEEGQRATEVERRLGIGSYMSILPTWVYQLSPQKYPQSLDLF